MENLIVVKASLGSYLLVDIASDRGSRFQFLFVGQVRAMEEAVAREKSLVHGVKSVANFISPETSIAILAYRRSPSNGRAPSRLIPRTHSPLPSHVRPPRARERITPRPSRWDSGAGAGPSGSSRRPPATPSSGSSPRRPPRAAAPAPAPSPRSRDSGRASRPT